MALTYEPIATSSINANTFSFSSIPSTYTDLKVIIVGVGTTGGTQLMLRFNNDSSALYSWTFVRSFGASLQSLNSSNMTEIYATDTGNGISTTIPTATIIDVFSYAGSNNKTLLQTVHNNQDTTGAYGFNSWLYRSSTAISSLNFFMGTGNFVGKVTLYGIKAA